MRLDFGAVRSLKERMEGAISIGGPTLAAAALHAGLADGCAVFLNPVSVDSVMAGSTCGTDASPEGQNGSMSRIAIIGGHGKVALHLSTLLTEEGHSVTSYFRNPDHAGDVAQTGATPSVLDIENATTAAIAGALEGHDAVVWSAGAGGGNPARTYAVDRDAAIRSMDAAAQAGVGRYVMVSYLGARKDHGVPESNGFFAYAEAKAAADEYLRGTGLAWTILGPGALTDRPGTGLIDVDPSPEGSGETSRSNTASVAAAVLDLPGTAGRTIEFCDGTLPIAAALQP